ncbi:ABC transporter ATP-binding protein [Virgibacillus siamensis]|uniref:ABC transporter ATP-binding protein n=1 Tax=Virgibacillus siamensis TaxID=480071 RepID=UPI0009852DA2|nr:ABC transporter ATP-binding protein [Virgibacillus siamensis]
MTKNSIVVDNVTMKYMLSTEKIESVKEYIVRKIKGNMKYNHFHALNDVSFTIGSGDRVGVIGHNGAGKSTLLKIISGVIRPSKGNVTVNGNIAPLLELGAGFDPDFTGAENIYLNGALLGKSREFLEARYQEIVDYSELGEFIDVPVKNYSTGMRAKLGFSIATQIDPDILIVDEVLAVGDQKFKKKSFQTMKELMASGKTVVMVSHNLGQIQNMMDKVIWLEKGKVMDFGDAKTVIDKYKASINND